MWFLATRNRIADLLATDGDTDPLGLRRAKAIGILAQPAEAQRLLAAHHHHPDPHPEQATEQTRTSRPRVVQTNHLSDAAVHRGHGLARPEHGDPATPTKLRYWLTHTGCAVTVRPVTDPAHIAPVDAYEIPQWMRDAVRLRNLAETA